MRLIRHPGLADDIRGIAMHYAEVSERVLESFWSELDFVLASIERNPRSHHFDGCGLRRANFRRFPYHLLYDIDEGSVLLVVLRHDRRESSYGLSRRPG
jgi:plasmid stabilization system protein ParE